MEELTPQYRYLVLIEEQIGEAIKIQFIADPKNPTERSDSQEVFEAFIGLAQEITSDGQEVNAKDLN